MASATRPAKSRVIKRLTEKRCEDGTDRNAARAWWKKSDTASALAPFSSTPSRQPTRACASRSPTRAQSQLALRSWPMPPSPANASLCGRGPKFLLALPLIFEEFQTGAITVGRRFSDVAIAALNIVPFSTKEIMAKLPARFDDKMLGQGHPDGGTKTHCAARIAFLERLRLRAPPALARVESHVVRF